MKNEDNFKRITLCAMAYLVVALVSFFTGYYANPSHTSTAVAEETYSETEEETVWETAYVTEYDYTSAESAR